MKQQTSETWFERVMWVGIFANVALALPTLLWPAEMLALSRLPDAIPLVWVRFSSLLLILLSSFYVPAALDCQARQGQRVAGHRRAPRRRDLLRLSGA